jgi:hypothetical protein
MEDEVMDVRAFRPDFDNIAASGTGIVVAIFLIASLPLLLGLGLLLPGWLEDFGMFVVQAPDF